MVTCADKTQDDRSQQKLLALMSCTLPVLYVQSVITFHFSYLPPLQNHFPQDQLHPDEDGFTTDNLRRVIVAGHVVV
jgi:hypothetical protein